MRVVRLCSSSKTRAKILKSAGVEFIQSQIDFDEDSLTYKEPRAFVYHASLGKLKVAEAKFGLEYPLLCADTVISCQNQILRKAKNKDEARKILLIQSGSEVSIITSAHLKSKEFYFVDLSVTKYQFLEFDQNDLEKYLESNLWQDKAGACMVEGFCKKYIKRVNGFESCAKGLLIEKILPWIEE
jgi:septum formation protein